MSETRLPEEMPSNWTVASFNYQQGFGTLRRENGEEFDFDIGSWHLGGWKPSRRDEQITGSTSPLLPQVGESVRVEWKRSVTGKTVPRVVQPTERISTARREVKLAAWLKAIQKHTNHFAQLNPNTLVRALAQLDEDLAEEWSDGEPREPADYAYLLMYVAQLADENPDWGATHATWVYSDDHRWDRERACSRLPAMLGLAPRSVATAGDGYSSGTDESLSDYARACNQCASAASLNVRLHELEFEGDQHVFVCLPPAAFVKLVKGGYLEAAQHQDR